MPGSLNIFPSTALGVLLDQTAVIKSIPSGDDDTARTTVISSLQCSRPQALNQEEKERANLATVARLMRVHTAVSTTTITKRHRFVHGSVDYRIRAVTAVPDGSPYFLELLIEDEGVAA